MSAIKFYHQIIRFSTLIISACIFNNVKANISTYYYTQPATAHIGFGYTPGQACLSVPTFGGGRGIDFTRTIETQLGSSTLCNYIMMDYYDDGHVQVHELKGNILKLEYNCPAKLDYSIFSKTCEQPSDLSNTLPQKNLGAPTAVGVLPTCKGSAGGSVTMVGNPIDASTGNKFQQEIDYQSISAMPLLFERSYNSDANNNSRIGANWRDNYDRTITVEGDKATITREDGKQYIYIKTVNGWQTDPDVVSQLIQTEHGWIYKTTENTEETYNNAGRLTSIKTLNGLTQTLNYDENGRLQSVNDSFGRQLQFKNTMPIITLMN